MEQEQVVLESCAPLLTSLGLRSLDPTDPAYLGRHRADPAARDRAYPRATVWPWLIGSYVEAAVKVGSNTDGLLDGLEAHQSE